jgi:predicted metal-binding membrane protein
MSAPRAEAIRALPSAPPEVRRLSFLPIGALFALLIGGAWTYLAYMDWGMRHMDVGMDMWIMPQMTDWSAADLALVLLMWALMMAAMMLPSILPVILYISRFGSSAHVIGFVAGYAMAWGGFSIGATLVQWSQLEAALISPMMKSVSVPLSAAVLAAAGLFQFTPLKHTCLTECRSPWAAVLNESGAATAIRDGLRYGVFCVGCCWALMALMLVVGVMNLLWIAIITVYVIAEKWVPRAEWFSRVVGVLLCVGAIAAVGYSAR